LNQKLPEQPSIFLEQTTSELGRILAERRRAGLHIDAVIAVDAHPSLPERLFPVKDTEGFCPILQKTPYETFWQSMPYLQRLESGCKLEEHLLANQSNWGFFTVTAADTGRHCLHWRSLCEVLLPSGKKSFFRFQDPHTLCRMLLTFTQQELGWFLGPAASLILPAWGQDGVRTWLKVDHPGLSGRPEAELAQMYVAAKERPWWEVREEHLAGLADTQHSVLVYNLAEHLKSETPTIASMLDRSYGSVRLAMESYVDAAMSHGLTEETDITIFVKVTLLLPFGSENSPGVREAMAEADKDPAAALLRLIDTVESGLYAQEAKER
jgi:hypothetical protein